MNEAEFQSWKLTREKGFTNYFLKNCLTYFLAIVVLFTALNVITSYYSYGTVVMQILSASIVVVVIQVARWFQREKKFKESLKTFNS